MSKIIFILGGARSGKSALALKLAKRQKKVAFIATARAQDQEMRQRISRHKQSRPKHWQTIEEYEDIASALKKIADKSNCLIIDCLTLLISNLFLAGHSEAAIKANIDKMAAALNKYKGMVIIVSNEVGLGIVPNNKLSRNFRDIAGRTNQMIAQYADQVFFMVSGIPWRIK